MDATGLLRRCRLDAELAQRQTAIRAGTTRTAISRLEGSHLSQSVETIALTNRERRS